MLAWAYEDGAPPAYTGGFGEDSCHSCHADNDLNDMAGALAVSGLPALYQPGQRYRIKVALEHPELESGGLQLSMRTADGRQAGTWLTASERLQLVSEAGVDYVVHSAGGRNTDTPGAISWTVLWTAPGAGDVVLNIAANAANDDYSALGDFIFTLEQRAVAIAR